MNRTFPFACAAMRRFVFLIGYIICACSIPIYTQVRTILGSEVLLSEKLEFLKSKRVAVVSNARATLPNGEHLIDSLLHSGVTVHCVFSPEHGFSSNVSAGQKVAHQTYPRTEIPVYSLYGEYYKPSQEMLGSVDILLYDLQDVGARFYTYISTLRNILESCAENNIPVIVLDRPNPLSGGLVDGPILDTAYKSFVGCAPIPVVYGMTCGELAQFFRGEKMIKNADKMHLTVIPMKNWSRKMYFDETGLIWSKPSPNLPKSESALIYPGTCLFESTNVSEGRGTGNPFQFIGAPFVDPKKILGFIHVNADYFTGLAFDSVEFTPRSIPDAAMKPKHQNVLCRGVALRVTDKKALKPFTSGIALLAAFAYTHRDSVVIKKSSFQRLTGNGTLFEQLTKELSLREIIGFYNQSEELFFENSRKYYLYN